jgi:Ca-activated chloride channel family protein
MRVIVTSILMCFALWSFSQKVSESYQNYGKVKDWNNPVFEIAYTNVSGKSQMFLPTAYSSSFKIKVEKEKLAPGESTIIRIQYFTEEFGKFDEQVELFVSTQGEPLRFGVAGRIMSFHPDALTVCPRIDNSDLVIGTNFNHTVRVIDQETGLPLSEFDIEISTSKSKESFFSDKASVTFKKDKPNFYFIEVDKQDYKIARREVYISRNSPETIIELKREKIEEEEYFDFTSVSVELEEKPETEIADETYVYTEIDEPKEEPTPIVEENPTDTVIVTPPIVDVPLVTDTARFDADGKLNSKVFAFNHIVFLVDISGSMRHEDKLPLLKYSINQMIDILRPQDKVTIITYSTEAKVIINSVSGNRKEQLKEAINKLEAKGHSYGKEGLDMAYKLAQTNFISSGNNEIILASDGVFNSKNFSERKLYRQVGTSYRDTHVRLSTIGFGHGLNALSFLEQLANKGEGNFIRIKNEEEARTVLIKNLMQHSYKL